MSTTEVTSLPSDESQASPAGQEQISDRQEAFVCLSKLPPFHPAALKLLSISGESESAMSDFESVFKSDPALSADLLLVANSMEFGLRSRIDTVRHALTFLGLERVRDLGCTIAFSFYIRNVPRAECSKSIWTHSLATAVIAELIATEDDSHVLYTAGLTHDLGRLAMFRVFGEEYAANRSLEFANIEEANAAENSIFGVTHCEAGEYVAQDWAFPANLRACMCHHHAPIVDNAADPPNVIRVACRLADYLGFPEVLRQDMGTPPDIPACLCARRPLQADQLREHVLKRIETFDRIGVRGSLRVAQ